MIKSKENISRSVVTGQVPPQYKGTVFMRVIKQEFGPSKSSGAPMITLETEIIHPDTVKSDLDGKEYSIAGQKTSLYLILSEVTKDGKAWDSLEYITLNLLPLLGFAPEIDDEQPLKTEANPSGLDFIGKQFEAIVTTEQRKEFKRMPDGSSVPVTDQSGKEINRGWQWKFGMKDILRSISMESNQAF